MYGDENVYESQQSSDESDNGEVNSRYFSGGSASSSTNDYDIENEVSKNTFYAYPFCGDSLSKIHNKLLTVFQC